MTGHLVEAAEPVAALLASIWPVEPGVPDDVAEGYRFLGLAEPQRWLAASDALGACVGLLFAGLVVGVGAPTALPLALVVAVLPPLAARQGVMTLASLARSQALGAAPALLGRLVLRLRVEPSLERAVQFAAASGAGADRLSDELGAHARQSGRTPESGLRAFAAGWADHDPCLERACALVVAAANAPAEERIAGCERALETILDGTQDRLARFAADVQAPVTGLYAFGVLLPLALVGVLPAARVAGISVPLSVLVVLYDLVLPVGLAAGGGWLLAQRPVAFPPTRVPRSHPEVPDSRLHAVGFGLVAGAAAGVVAAVVLPWATLLAAVGVGLGTALTLAFRPEREVREQVDAVEQGLPDALALVGRRVADGVALERALAATAGELSGETGALLDRAARRGARLRIDVHRAFVGEVGVLQEVPSRRAREAATLFTLAATEGQPAGEVLVAAGDHLRELRRVEREARRELATVTGTLANTAVLFGPLVGGVTVAMAGGLSTATGAGGGGGAFPLPALGQAIGLYVLLLAAELTALSTVLEQGVDRALLGYRVGVALPTATVAYVGSVVVAGQVL